MKHALAFLLAIGYFATARAEPPDSFDVTTEAYDRAFEIYDSLLEQHFKFDNLAFASVRFHASLPSTNRASAEYAFSLRSAHRGLLYFEGEDIEARYRKASDYSILIQVARAITEGKVLEPLKAPVSIASAILNSTTCPAIRGAVLELSKLRIRPLNPDAPVYLDGPGFEFELLDSSSRSRLEVTDPNHPLAKWADDTRAILERCAAT